MKKILFIIVVMGLAGFVEANSLILAVMTNCNVDVVERLVESGVSARATNDVGSTTLMIAAQYNTHPEVIEKLVELGADVGEEATRLAAQSNNSEVMEALITAGADIHTRDRLGGTILMDAAMRNSHTDVLGVIVRSGVEVDAVDNFGHTALIEAVKYNAETDALERLVNLGADVNVKTKAELTALHMASSNRDTNTVKRLLLLDADVDAVKKNGRTMLIDMGKFKGDTPVFNLLLEFGADVNVRANDGTTALMEAAEFNNANSIYVLVKKGADPTPIDELGMSALDYADRYAARIDAEEETEVQKILKAALQSQEGNLEVVIPEPELTIKFSKCFLKYNTMNGETEIILYNIRQSRMIKLSEAMFKDAFDLTEFEVEELLFSEPGTKPPVIRVLARTKNFMMNAPVEQLFSNILNTQAKAELQIAFPQMKMSVFLPMQKNMYVGENNALQVLQIDEKKETVIEFDISTEPLEVVVGWKKKEPVAAKIDHEFQRAIQQFQRDADVVRLEHILYWSELIEEYHKQKGSYPFQTQLEENDFAILVKIATKIQRQFISPGSKDYNSELDMNATGQFKELPVSKFISELENVLGREIKEHYDIQKAPTVSPVGYYYFSTPDGYLIWCICPTYGVSKISTLLMDGVTPTVNIVSKGMKGKVTKALLRQELIENPIFKEWRQRKLTENKESYVRQLIVENEKDSKKP